MLKRPRLTRRVLRGLEAVAAHAAADREAVATKESWPSEHVKDLDVGLAYIRALGHWYRRRTK